MRILINFGETLSLMLADCAIKYELFRLLLYLHSRVEKEKKQKKKKKKENLDSNPGLAKEGKLGILILQREFGGLEVYERQLAITILRH